MNSLSEKQFLSRQNILDIGRYINIVKRKWLTITFFVLTCTTTSLFIVMNLVPMYKATATLKLEANTNNAISIESVVGIDTSKQEYYLTEFEIIKSRAIAHRVIEELQLAKLPEFNPTIDSNSSLIQNIVKVVDELTIELKGNNGQITNVIDEAQQQYIIEQRVLSRFLSRLSVVPIRRTHLVRISYESLDPVLAANIANAVGEAYIDEGLRARLEVEAKATTWINSRLSELREQLRLSEVALNDFLESEHLIDNSGIDGQVTASINDVRMKLAQVTDKRIQLESEFATLNVGNLDSRKAFSATDSVSLHPQVISLNTSLTNAAKEIDQLSKRYGPKHKKMIAARAKRDSLSRQLDVVVGQLVYGVGQELDSVRAQERMLQSEMNLQLESYQSLSLKKRKYDSLLLEVQTNRKILNLFLNRQKETSALGGFQVQSARFTDVAVPPLRSIKPNTKVIVLSTLLATSFMAIGFVLILDALRTTIESVKGCEERLGLIPLGEIPKIKLKKRQSIIDNSMFFDDKFLSFSESIRSIRTVISLMNRENKYIAIASALPGEGKTTTALNLAVAYAQTERTLIIDADLRNSNIAERFGLDSHEKGIIDHLLMGDSIKDCIHKDQTSGVSVLPTGMLASNPQDVLGSSSFAKMLSNLADHFDRIIIDTPPALTVSDSLIIGKLAKNVILVVKANSTRIRTFRNIISRFSNHGVGVEGVILNEVKMRISPNENGNYTANPELKSN